MSNVLDRNSILGAMRLKSETVELESGSVIVSEIDATDYIKLWSDPANQKKDAEGKDSIDMSRFIPALVAFSVVDAVGNRIFTDEDIPLLSRSSQEVFLKIAQVAKRLNGLGVEEVKNSDDNQNG